MKNLILSLITLLLVSSPVSADLPQHDQLQKLLKEVVKTDNGGFGHEMWATIVDRDGQVIQVVFSGEDRSAQWPGSRLISAQKAYTANAFSLPAFALSTANLFSAVQPGGSLFGLQLSNPLNADKAYKGKPKNYGQDNDPLVGEIIGGINVFGGGLALYKQSGELLGALGVSGDSSCADHNIAWKLRSLLELDYVPAGVGTAKDKEAGGDNIIYDIADAKSKSGWGHPECAKAAAQIAQTALPQLRKKKQ